MGGPWDKPQDAKENNLGRISESPKEWPCNLQYLPFFLSFPCVYSNADPSRKNGIKHTHVTEPVASPVLSLLNWPENSKFTSNFTSEGEKPIPVKSLILVNISFKIRLVNKSTVDLQGAGGTSWRGNHRIRVPG